MKRIFRIIIGFPLSPILMLLATWIWLFSNDNETWVDCVWPGTWHLASGNWDKLPE